MNVTEKVSRFLDHKIPYMIETQSDPFETVDEEEQSVPPCDCLARSVAVDVDGKVWIVVTPASEQLNLRRLKDYLGAGSVALLTKEESGRLFSDCETGEMPIFGSLYGLPVLVPHELTDHEEISFPAGNREEIIRIRLRDFLITEKPCVCARNTILSGGEREIVE